MDFLFLDTGPSEIVRRLTTPPPAYVQPINVTPPPTRFALACRGYIEGTTPTSCPRQPSGPSGIGITGGVSSPDAPPPREEGLDDTILDDDGEETLLCYMEQDEERDVDIAAQLAANQIRNLNNSDENPSNHEFGTFVIRLSDGTFVTAFPTEGSTGGVSLSDMLADAQAEFGNQIGAANIAGIVHLHPSEAGSGFVSTSSLNDLSPLDYGNVMPSHPNIGIQINPYTGLQIPPDWPAARAFLENRGHSNVDNISHYILGPDGVLREYDYSDPHPAEQSEQQEHIENAEEDAKSRC